MLKIIAIVYYFILLGYSIDFFLLLFGVTAIGQDLIIPFILLTLMGVIACCYFIQLFRLRRGIMIILTIISIILITEQLTHYALNKTFFILTWQPDSILLLVLNWTTKYSIWLFIFAVSYALGFRNSRTLQPLIASFVAIVFYVLVIPLVYDPVQFMAHNNAGLLYENAWPITFIWLAVAFIIDLILLQLEVGYEVVYSKICTRKILILFYSLMALIISICALAGLWLTSIVAAILIIATTTLLLEKEDKDIEQS